MMNPRVLLVLLAAFTLAGCAEQRSAMKRTMGGVFEDKNEQATAIKKAAAPRARSARISSPVSR